MYIHTCLYSILHMPVPLWQCLVGRRLQEEGTLDDDDDDDEPDDDKTTSPRSANAIRVLESLRKQPNQRTGCYYYYY